MIMDPAFLATLVLANAEMDVSRGTSLEDAKAEISKDLASNTTLPPETVAQLLEVYEKAYHYVAASKLKVQGTA